MQMYNGRIIMEKDKLDNAVFKGMITTDYSNPYAFSENMPMNVCIGYDCGTALPTNVHNVTGIGAGDLADATSNSIYIGNEHTTSKIRVGGLHFETSLCTVCQELSFCIMWRSNRAIYANLPEAKKQSLCLDCIFDSSLECYAKFSFANHVPGNGNPEV